MNDRLIEIYRSCRPKEALASQDQYQSANALLGSEVEKFAELIVQECVNICNTTTDRGYLNGVIAGHKIKEHFGVE